MSTTCHATFSGRIDPSVDRLLRAYGAAMAVAGIDEAVDELLARVVTPHRLLTIKHDGPCSFSMALTPFAELALRQSIHIAQDGALDGATKLRRVRETLALSGF